MLGYGELTSDAHRTFGVSILGRGLYVGPLTNRRSRGACGLRAAVAEDRTPIGARFRIGASFQRLNLLKQRSWRKRVRVETTTNVEQA